MGRGPRTQALSGATALAPVTRSETTFAAQISAIADAICASGDNYLEELEELNTKAQTSKDGPTKTASRGGRLMVAVSDIFEAERLANSPNPSDQLIARAMLDSALPHLGRIVALADKDSPILPELSQAIAQYEHQHGLEQIADLERRGLISQSTADDLRSNLSELQDQAYASGAARPRWLAVPFMQRGAAALEGLEASRALVDDGSDAAEVIDHAIDDCHKVIKGASAWLDDPQKGGNLRLNAPGQLIKAEAVLAACRDPETRALNNKITAASEINKDLVRQVGDVPDEPLFVVPDSRWLDLGMNYQMILTGPTANTIAMTSPKNAIYLSPDIGREAIEAYDRGELSSTLVHELIHTTQSAPPAEPLKDKGQTKPGQLYDRHRTLENKLTEGATQGLTNHLVGQSQDVTKAQNEHYPVYTALVDEVADHVATDAPSRHQFYRDLSACPDNRRAAFLAEKLDGTQASEDRVRQFTDQMLPVCDLAEQQGCDYQSSRKLFADTLA